MLFQHPTQSLESARPLSNDERLAVWAAKFYGGGFHHTAPGGHLARHSFAERYAAEQMHTPVEPIHEYAAIRGE